MVFQQASYAVKGGNATRIAICEDTVSDMELLLDLCDAYAKARGLVTQIMTYGRPEKMLADPSALSSDVVLLDIMMPGQHGFGPNGIALARELRALGYTGSILLITTSVDYYSEGFEVDAQHYLLKPLTYESFAIGMDRVVRQMQSPQRVITVPVDRVQVPIPQDMIYYAEVFGRETILHTATETVRVLLPLKKIETLLDGEPFLRCYRSYIVNMDYVISLEEDHFLMRGNVRIPISLRSRQSIKERYFAYRLSRVRDEDGPAIS